MDKTVPAPVMNWEAQNSSECWKKFQQHGVLQDHLQVHLRLGKSVTASSG